MRGPHPALRATLSRKRERDSRSYLRVRVRLAEVSVADFCDGDDDGGVCADSLLQLAAETRDVRVDGAAVQIQIDAVVPHARQELVAWNDTLLVLEQIHEQVELFRRELQLLIRGRRFARRRIETDELILADRLRRC